MTHWGIDWNDFFKRIASIESSNNPNAYNGRENAIGLLQIRAGVIRDVNDYFKTTYTHKDAFSPILARRIGKLYLLRYGKTYEKRFGVPPNSVVLARIWNGGYAGLLRNPNATNNYIVKYYGVLTN